MSKLKGKHEKLDFIFDELKLDINHIASVLGVKSGTISGWRKSYNNKEIKPMYLYALESAFGIPYKIFDDVSIDTKEKIQIVLQKSEGKKVFNENQKLLDHLVGDWYAYLYPHSTTNKIYDIKTTIKPDGSVIDENGNWGEVFLGTNQSMLIKETDNSKNLVSITFENIQVPYGLFYFSLVSKINHINRAMMTFGFFSRTKIELEMAEKILGEKEKLQLKIDYDFLDRIGEYVDVVR